METISVKSNSRSEIILEAEQKEVFISSKDIEFLRQELPEQLQRLDAVDILSSNADNILEEIDSDDQKILAESILRNITYALLAGNASPLEKSFLPSLRSHSIGLGVSLESAIKTVEIMQNITLSLLTNKNGDAIAKELGTYFELAIKALSWEQITGNILTMEEIIGQYPNEWLLIAYTELDQDFNVVKGEVLAHSPDRDRLYENSLPRKGKSIAIEYTGSVPEDLAIATRLM